MRLRYAKLVCQATHSTVILRSRALARRLEGRPQGACGPSFEARREERRAPQDDGSVGFAIQQTAADVCMPRRLRGDDELQHSDARQAGRVVPQHRAPHRSAAAAASFGGLLRTLRPACVSFPEFHNAPLARDRACRRARRCPCCHQDLGRRRRWQQSRLSRPCG